MNTNKLNYIISGNGEAIILIHGFVESLEIWEDLIPVLNKNYKVLAVDLPGHGASPLSDHDVSIEDMAVAINSILEKEKINTCVMIGHSMGGYVAMAFANLYPDKLSGLCLFHSSAYGDTPEKKEGRLRSVEAAKKDHKDFLFSLVSKLFKEGNENKFPDEARKLKEIAINTSTEAVVAGLMAMRNRPDLSSVLAKLNIPVQFIWGKHDNALDFETVFPQAKLPSEAHILILDAAGHLGFVEAKQETYRSLENFAEFCLLQRKS